MFTCALSNDTLPEMVAPLILRDLYWGLTVLLEGMLLLYLVRRKRYRSHPAFFRYIVLIIVQSGILAITYVYLGEHSESTYRISWATQGIVICARWLAVIEIARRTLARYAGIWALANRILLALSACVLAYSIVTSRSAWTLVFLNANRAMALCIAAFIVVMFVFVRYYRVEMLRFERMLAIGFCLYSCFAVINDSILETWLGAVATLWTYLDMLTFLASLLLWIGAARTSPESSSIVTEPVVKSELYWDLAQKLNSRLHLLNHRLNHLFRSEDSHL
jgi:hypothetical protein